MNKSIILRTTAFLAISAGLSGCAINDSGDVPAVDLDAAQAFLAEYNEGLFVDAPPTYATNTASLAGNIVLAEGGLNGADEVAVGELTLEIDFSAAVVDGVTGTASNFSVGDVTGESIVFVETLTGELDLTASIRHEDANTEMYGFLIGELSTAGGEVTSVNNPVDGEFKNIDGVGVAFGLINIDDGSPIGGGFVAVGDAFDVDVPD